MKSLPFGANSGRAATRRKEDCNGSSTAPKDAPQKTCELVSLRRNKQVPMASRCRKGCWRAIEIEIVRYALNKRCA